MSADVFSLLWKLWWIVKLGALSWISSAAYAAVPEGLNILTPFQLMETYQCLNPAASGGNRYVALFWLRDNFPYIYPTQTWCRRYVVAVIQIYHYSISMFVSCTVSYGVKYFETVENINVPKSVLPRGFGVQILAPMSG